MQQRYQRRVRIIVRDSQGEVEPRGLLAKVAGAIVGVAVLVVAFMFSVVALAIVAVVVVFVAAYLWWKTRDLRRRLRENPPGGRVIDGDVIRDRD